MSVIILGGGASGLVAAIAAARRGARVVLIEKNEKLGKKLYITGKGRCNITNACPPDELIENVIANPSFLYSAFYTMDADGVIAFFNDIGVGTKIERGGRVFPVKDNAGDVVRALEKSVRALGVRVLLNTAVRDIKICEGAVCGVFAGGAGEYIEADRVIIATGGLAYPSTGSTGDGYRFAKNAGHTITPLSPSLTSLIVKEDWVRELQGLSLRNVEITVKDGKKKLYNDFGEMLFTHLGVSGPIILSASRFAAPGAVVSINLKPALSEKQLDERILRDFSESINREFINALGELLPKSLIPVFVRLTGIDPRKRVRDITREERRAIVGVMRGTAVTVTGNTGFRDAVITAGGVCVDEINPSTMESKLISGLYFAGEVLDVDAFTGGFNLQIAFSTGYMAGINSAGGEENENY